MVEIDDLSGVVVNAAVGIHRELGPGLLESVYEMVLAGTLARKGLKVDRQRPIDVVYDGVRYHAAFRIDLFVEDKLVVEIKSVEQLAPVHGKQLLTYLRLSHQPVGLLLNFSGATMKEGIRRVVNDYRQRRDSSASPRLRVNQLNGESRCST
ncbi:MAG TPA: GxxExxY protein, partial [Croceibacterium sp.]|nr:GxxExxY protein [Croceibacterium sp.]